jgi:hypothetical protein
LFSPTIYCSSRSRNLPWTLPVWARTVLTLLVKASNSGQLKKVEDLLKAEFENLDLEAEVLGNPVNKWVQVSLSGDDIREGMISIISLRHPDAKYSSQTKTKLVSDVNQPISNLMFNQLVAYLDQNPVMIKKIITM